MKLWLQSCALNDIMTKSVEQEYCFMILWTVMITGTIRKIVNTVITDLVEVLVGGYL